MFPIYLKFHFTGLQSVSYLVICFIAIEVEIEELKIELRKIYIQGKLIGS